jgi:hypothetical protein
VLSPYHAMGCNPVSMVDPLGLQSGMHPFTKPLGMQDPAAFGRSIAPTLAEHAPGGSKWGLSNMARYISTLPSEMKGEAWLQYLTGGAGGSLFKENLTEHYRKEDIRNDERRTAERIMELYETLVYGGAKGRGWVPEEQRFYHDEVIAQTSRPSNYWREWLGQQSNGGGQDALDPSTVGKNFFGLSYPGPNNPMTYGGKPDYTTVPKVWSEYPAIGHDRRYDKLGITGAKGLLLDSRALYADLQFIAEEKAIFLNPGTPLFDRATAGLFSFGMSIAIIPKTATTLSTPTGIINFAIGAAMTYKVNNIPGK